MSELGKGPQGLRRGRGSRERILAAAGQLFRTQGFNNTGLDEVCAAAKASKRTVYQHFGSKDDLISEYLRRHDPDTMPDVFDRPDLTPRERLLAAFQTPPESTGDGAPLCPFVGASAEIADPEHPARVRARQYKQSVTKRLSETARDAGADNPDLLGAQLALLLDGASVQTRIHGSDAAPTAAHIAIMLIEHDIPNAPSAA